MYNRYEKAVHDKDRDRDQLKRFVCSSPVYVDKDPDETFRINESAPFNSDQVDDGRQFKDQGINPGLGSFHFYHRIDGKLVAMGVNDITSTILNS